MQQNPPPPPPRKAPLGKPRTLTEPAGAPTPPADQRIPVAGPPKPPAGQSVPVAGPPQARATRHYGHTPRRSIEVRTQRYLLFGIPYAISFVPGSLLLFIVGLVTLIFALSSSGSMDALPASALGVIVGLGAFSAIALPFSIVVVVQCVRGSTTGLVLGIVHVAIVLLLIVLGMSFAIASPYANPGPGQYFGLFICGAVLVLGLVQLKQRESKPNHLVPHDLYDGPPLHLQPGGVYAPSANPAPAPAPKAAPKPKPALSDSQRAFIELLGIAASIDDSRAETRLKRARQAAHKILGPDHRAAVMNLLNEPALIGNLHDDLDAVAKQIREDDRLRAVALKAAAAVLRDENVLDDQATELLQHLKLALA